jgi:hypothetical protein
LCRVHTIEAAQQEKGRSKQRPYGPIKPLHGVAAVAETGIPARILVGNTG